MTSNPSTEQLHTWDSQHYWHAFTQMQEYEPFILERGEGVYIYDIHGRRYLDACSSLWCNIHGHQHPTIDAAIKRQLGKVAHVTSLGVSNPTTITLAKKLVDLTPSELDCVFFSSDGSSAVEVGLKLAFQYWRQRRDAPSDRRDLYLAVGNAYHGDTLGSVSVGGVSRFHAMFSPLLFDVIHGPCPDTFRVPPEFDLDADDPDSLRQLSKYYLDEYRKLFEQFGDRIAAVIVEPLVQCAAGMVVQPAGFLRGLKELTQEFDSLLIADEIAVGMGRSGTLWACEQESVAPDILCAGKGLSGGYLPMAATLTTREIWDAFLGEYSESRSFFHGHTFGGNPLCAAAALATFEVFEQEKTLENAQRQSAILKRLLDPLLDYPHVGDVRVQGMMAAIELVQDPHTKAGFPWSAKKGYELCDLALERGVWLRPIGNVVIVMPPLCSQESHMREIVQALEYALRRMWS
ncbi:MAG: adenosylmethionine--8-amino-7-oxononanoate transaminase [Planctomycetota bacterium]